MSEKHRQQATYESDEDVSDDQQYKPEPEPQTRGGRQMQRRQQQRRGGMQGGVGPLDNLALNNVGNTAQGVVGGVTNTLGGVASNAIQGGREGGKKDNETLRLRLDLNLDIEITLKAKIHGDLELALLYVTSTQLTYCQVQP